MANILPKDKQIAVINTLAEGSSMRAISRITGIHQDTICRLGVRVGKRCGKILDAKMRDLTCRYTSHTTILCALTVPQNDTRDDGGHRDNFWTVGDLVEAAS